MKKIIVRIVENEDESLDVLYYCNKITLKKARDKISEVLK